MRLIAYYLPQFHEIPENNEWWGKGFTEWNNVKKAEPLFDGHEQPKIPGELGYYNLKVPDIREKQAELAKDAGIEAFCYWHYWFGNGKQLLEKPFEEVLSSGKPKIKFCLGWANESWKAKVWSSSNGNDDKTLIEQTYPGVDDIVNHFHHLLKAFKDQRYLKVNNRPLFVIYKPEQVPDMPQFINIWNTLAVENGLEGIYFVGYVSFAKHVDRTIKLGFDAVNVVRLGDCRRSKKLVALSLKNLILYALHKKPFVYNYRSAITELSGKENSRLDVFPTIIPNWDHTPRSGIHGFVLHKSTPEYFRKHVEKVINSISGKPKDMQIVFLKSWNEWGEGNYIEPDDKYGRKYLEVLKSLTSRF
jgi:hypothetical protein